MSCIVLATYIGRGTIDTTELRRIFTTTIRRWNVFVPPSVPRRRSAPVFTDRGGGNGGDGGGADPQAQTFILEEDRHLTAVSFKITKIGDANNPIIVQIRETTAGIPNGVVIAEGLVSGAGIALGWSKVPLRAPVFLSANTRYSVVLMTNDATHSVAIADIGEFDAAKQAFMTAQPYRTGTRLSSSDAATWTPHPKSDLTFRLHAARFTATQHVVDCGQFDVVDMTDLIAFALTEEPASDVSIGIRITRANGDVIETRSGEPIQFFEKISEIVGVAAILRGTALHSPVLYPRVQLVVGSQDDQGDYVSRAIQAGTDSRVVVVIETLISGAATLDLQFGNEGAWVDLPDVPNAIVDLGDGWQEREYILPDFDQAEGRVKLAFTGSPSDRPLFRNLRTVVTESGL